MNISLILGWFVVVVFRLGRSFVSLASVESFMNSHLVMTHSRLRVIEVKSNLCGESESQLGRFWYQIVHALSLKQDLFSLTLY